MKSSNWVDIPQNPSKWPFFYGWVIVFCSSVGVIASIPGQTIGVGVFVDFLVDVIKLSADNLSLAYLIGTLASSMTMPFAGRLLDRWGARSMGVISSIGLGRPLAVLQSAISFLHRAMSPGFAPWRLYAFCSFAYAFLVKDASLWCLV